MGYEQSNEMRIGMEQKKRREEGTREWEQRKLVLGQNVNVVFMDKTKIINPDPETMKKLEDLAYKLLGDVDAVGLADRIGNPKTRDQDSAIAELKEYAEKKLTEEGLLK